MEIPIPDIYPTTYPESIERNNEAQRVLLNKLKSDNINDFKISIKEDQLDSCAIIIGVNLHTLDVDIYGYDYNKSVLEFTMSHLKIKFPNYKFEMKWFDTVL